MPQREYISLHRLQTLVRQRLIEAFPLPVWVTAEIAELKVNYSGHCYMELIDKRSDGNRAIPEAKTSAVIWRSRYPALDTYFASATGGHLAVGLKVLVLVTVNFHELYGYSLVISDIEPSYTLGDLERQRRETVEKLKADGVFDMNRSLPLPPIMQRVAVVSSRNAAGYQDFMKELARSGYRVETELFDSFMQGDGAEAAVIEALASISERAGEFDVAVIIRGGGSRSDLSCFDSYLLCSCVAQMPLPVLTGIGHDKDTSVADMVAAEMLKTPTAVAGRIVESMAAFEALLDDRASRLTLLTGAVMDESRTRLEFAARRLSAHATGMTRRLELQLERLGGEVVRRAAGVVSRHAAVVERLDMRLRSGTREVVRRGSERLGAAEQIVAAHDPRRILALGFGMVRGADGRVVRSVNQLGEGQSVRLELADGAAALRVESKENN